MIKCLPITVNPHITSECWTYYKFAILQSQKYYWKWLCNNMGLFVDYNGNALYGEKGNKYPLSYFDTVLNFSTAKFSKISSEKIVDFIIRSINNGKYVILDVNINKINNSNKKDFKLHETLIYGYDTKEKCFYSPILFEKFKVVKIDFETLISAYDDARMFYLSNKNKIFERITWFNGITLVKPISNYRPSNLEYDFYCRLKRESQGRVCSFGNSFENINATQHIEGLLKYTVIENRLDKVIKGELNKNSLFGNLHACSLKIYEVHNMMSFVFEKFLIKYKHDTSLNTEYERYKLCCHEMKKIILLIEKFYYTHNEELIIKIRNGFSTLYDIEKDIYEKYANRLRELYTKRII